MERHLRHCNKCQAAAAAGVSDEDIREVDALREGLLVAGRFTLQESLGQTGRGEVWRAFDSELQRAISIEFFRVKGAPQACALILLGETRKLSEAQSPALVPVYDAGLHEGLAFIATELTEPLTFSEWSRGEGRRWREVTSRFLPVVEAVKATHRVGLIHGDIQPNWVRVDEGGQARIRGFGLFTGLKSAVAVNTTAKSFSYWTIKSGSIVADSALSDYAPPEQLSGAEPSVAGDVFSVTAVLYEALTGMKPFIAPTRGELIDKMHKPVLFPETPKLPAELRRLLTKGLSTTGEARFTSAEALGEALRRLLGKRKRALVRMAAAATAMLVLAGGAFGVWKYREHRCGLGTSELATYLSPSARDGWLSAWKAQGANGELGAKRTSALLDAFVTTWSESRDGVCRANVQEDAAGATHRVCLENQAALLGTLGTLARENDPHRPALATRALSQMTSPDACLRLPASTQPPATGRSAALLRARAFVLGGEYAAAVKEATSAVEDARRRNARHDELEALVLTGEAQSRLGQEKDARETLAKAKSLADELNAEDLLPEVLLASARAMSLSKTPAALEEAKQTLDAAEAASKRIGGSVPFEAQALEVRGQLELWSHRADEAIAAFENAAQKHKTPATLEALGDALMDAQRAGNATERFGEALEESRGLYLDDEALPRSLRRSRALSALAAGKLTESLQSFEDEAKQQPALEAALASGDVDALLLHARLAGVKGNLGQVEPAVATLEKIVETLKAKKLAPVEGSEVFRLLAELYAQKGEGLKGALLARDNFLRVSQALPATSPELAEARCTLGQARMNRADLQGALMAFEEGLAALPESARGGPNAWCLQSGIALNKVNLGNLDVDANINTVLEKTVAADTAAVKRDRALALYARSKVAYRKGERDRGAEWATSAARELEGVEGVRFEGMRRVISRLSEQQPDDSVEQGRPQKKKRAARARSRSRAAVEDDE